MQKAEIVKQATTFNFYDPVTEAEFEDAIDILAQYLLFETGWESILSGSPKMRRKIPIIYDVPLICRADECPYASQCPIFNAMEKRETLKLIGTKCRADKIYATEMFSSFVKDLEIDPSQTNDVIGVANMVRLLILKRRVDWQIARDGLLEREPSAVDPKTGQVYFKSVVHPLLKHSESLEKQLASAQKQLMADRQTRAALAASTKSNLSILKELFSGNLKALQPNTIEAEFSDNTEVKEE